MKLHAALRLCASALTPLVFLASLAGCPASEPAEAELWLSRLTATPVAAEAEVVNPFEDEKRITLSAGIAVGLACTQFCPGAQTSSCGNTTVTVTPEGLGTIHPAFLIDGREGAVVLVAKEPGVGTLQVTSSCTSETYRLRVEPRQEL